VPLRHIAALLTPSHDVDVTTQIWGKAFSDGMESIPAEKASFFLVPTLLLLSPCLVSLLAAVKMLPILVASVANGCFSLDAVWRTEQGG
jgi:hypothetical protein